MNLLFDQNISFRVKKMLSGNFTGCKHVFDCKLNNSEDSDIWSYAKEKGYTIVTFDSDFYDMSLINGHPPKIIWIRTGNMSTKEVAQLINSNQKVIESFLYHEELKDTACLELDI